MLTPQTGMPFLAWYDDAKAHTLAQKVEEAAQAYQDRYGRAPTVALVCPDDLSVPLADALVTVRPAANIRPNTVWVGRED